MNVKYKCISKIIVRKLKYLVSEKVCLNQVAFFEGTNINDNVLLAHELMRKYNGRNITNRCTIKIDLTKAFDYIRWDTIHIV